eukprot:TRINITY_DN1335_c0_g1_i3.p1 TRINITY_DN1335_c0_g1~~TRINITY_DN1335_c0_g1_i3.p1  ORF type:complete len:261 (-),score=89.30 TRINITY_DN1335_c0_g1_i3:96-878(-)
MNMSLESYSCVEVPLECWLFWNLKMMKRIQKVRSFLIHFRSFLEIFSSFSDDFTFFFFHFLFVLFLEEKVGSKRRITEGRKGDDRCVILTVQPRIPMGTFRMIEIPAGMVDEEGKFAGQAAKELEEECGLKIKEDQLIDLTELAYQHARKSLPQNEKGEGDDEDDNGKIGIYTSPGGSDEYLRLFLYKHSLPRSQIKEWEGKMTGNLDEGEKISLRVVPLKDLWKITKDAKALSALALWEGLKREGILDENDNYIPAKKE